MGQQPYHLAINELQAKPPYFAKQAISMCKTYQDARRKALSGETKWCFNADKTTIVNLYYRSNR